MRNRNEATHYSAMVFPFVQTRPSLPMIIADVLKHKIEVTLHITTGRWILELFKEEEKANLFTTIETVSTPANIRVCLSVIQLAYFLFFY